jgi:anthraniloyl-CoA monooxygenase
LKIDIIGGGPAGLYFAALIRKARPDSQVTVFERNPPDVTWGWGVVFSDGTLDNFREADPESHSEIVSTFARWDAIDTHFGGRTIRSGGHVFCGMRRMRLLEILQKRCRNLGVTLRFGHEVTDLPAHAGADLIVAADGVNSLIREAHAEHFTPDIAVGRSPYIWLATERLFESFTFIIGENEHGLFTVHSYPFDEKTSTFIVETDEESFRSAGLDRASEAESVAYCERLFAPWLDGKGLMSNRSMWLRFRRVKCERWHHGNLVLMGDAAHTAHFSIGSGTKLAMEDAIALAACLGRTERIEEALEAYYDARWLEVAKLQRVAEISQTWYEEIKRYRKFDPVQFTVGMMSRSRKVTHGNLRIRDGAYIASVDRWFADRNGCESLDPPPPPMFTPFHLRGMELANRVVVSPMCMYSAEDGTPNDWHLVHLGSRAVGGAGLVITEMTDVSRDGRISPGCAGMYKPGHVGAWKRIVDFVHTWSTAKVGMQLAHAGRKGATKVMWEGSDIPLEEGSWPLLGASAIPWAEGSQVPNEMTREDMDQVREDFVSAARMAQEAGFDMLELHLAHGYLLASFISPLTNIRQDEYGGSLRNRMRFPLEVFHAVRGIWPEEKPISVRLSGSDWLPGGFDTDEAVEAARMLKARGCDIIDVSSGFTTPDSIPVYQRMFQVHFSDRIRNEAGIPTMTVGEIRDWDMVNTALVSGHADLCVMGRPHLYDPYLTLHAAAEQGWHGVRWPDQYLPAAPGKPRGGD